MSLIDQLERKVAVLRASYEKVGSCDWGGVAPLQERSQGLREATKEHIEDLVKRIDTLKEEEAARPKIGNGPDVSSHQGSVDWSKVRETYTTAFVKATEGQTYVDPRAAQNIKNARAAGISLGAYHFARPDNNPALKEVDHFVSTVERAGVQFVSYADWKDGKPGVLGVLDFEKAPFNAGWAAAWGQAFAARTGVKAALYGYGSSLNPILSARNQFAFVWLAAYVTDWKPYYNGADEDVHFWQWTSSGACPGIAGPCDLNRYLK